MSEFDQGLLQYIPGPFLSAADKGLPPADSVGDKFREVQVVVTVRYERMESRHGKSRNAFWTPDSVRIEPMAESVIPSTGQAST